MLRSSLRALLGVAVIVAAISLLWTLGQAWIWVGIAPKNFYPSDLFGAFATRCIIGIGTLVAMGVVTAGPFGLAHCGWTDDLLKAIESRLPKRKPRSHPLSELAKAAKQGSLERAKLFVEDR